MFPVLVLKIDRQTKKKIKKIINSKQKLKKGLGIKRGGDSQDYIKKKGVTFKLYFKFPILNKNK